MHDSLGVRRVKPVCYLNAHLQKLRYFDGLPCNTVLQRLALEQLHSDKRPFFEFSNIVNGANVGVIERGCSARFAAESLDRLRIMGDIVGKEFQRDVAAKPRVFSFVDYTHSSAPKFFEDAIVGDGAAYVRRSIRHRPCIVRQRWHAGNRVACYSTRKFHG